MTVPRVTRPAPRSKVGATAGVGSAGAGTEARSPFRAMPGTEVPPAGVGRADPPVGGRSSAQIRYPNTAAPSPIRIAMRRIGRPPLQTRHPSDRLTDWLASPPQVLQEAREPA